MGLDTTHNCWHGAYSSFNRFRFSLAAQIGIDLSEYAGYSGDGTKNLADIEHKLMPLFNHSDCDGELSVEEAKSIKEGLDEVLLNFDETLDFDDFHFIAQIEQFRDGCIEAINKNEVIEFR